MKHFDNFFYPANDFEASKRFYADVLGLPVKFDFSQFGMIAFKVGDDEPAIILKDKTKFAAAQPCVWIEVENVKTLYDELKSKGVNFLSEPFQIKTGWSVELKDPSGNILGFTDYNQ